MRQILQNMSSGETLLAEVAAPAASAGRVLIRSEMSLISSGTERMLIDFGRAGWLGRARQQPDKVRAVIDKARVDGVAAALEAVRGKLDQPLALGYSSVGTVVGVGDGVQGFAPGDRVASNGPHAEWVSVPRNLCARVPDEVAADCAVYTVPAAIALQGMRLAAPTLGEVFAVTGLGLIGQLAVRLLLANGCRVLGIDPDAGRRERVARLGVATADPQVDDVAAIAAHCSRGRGIDGVLLTASTSSSQPLSQAAAMSRRRGRIVLVGVTGLKLSRADFYEKELSFQVSCAYGPGRYDADYELKGRDYPVGFVRWTEQRNFEAVLDMMARGVLDATSLTSHRYALQQALEGYALLGGETPHLGIVIDYPEAQAGALPASRSVALGPAPAVAPAPTGSPAVAFIGAGNHAGRVLMPAFRATGATLQWAVATSGVGPVHYGRKFGFRHAGTDTDAALGDEAVNTVVVATRHDSHAELVCRALAAGKHVFVEKPLALTLDELVRIETAWREAGRLLMVGFNRRFSPLAERMRALLSSVAGPKVFVVTINAGALPPDHWTQDPATGGGRIVGEACHFVDLVRHLAGAPIVDARRRPASERGAVCNDIATLELQLADGSIGSIHYLANGHRAYPKERIEVFCAGRVLRLENFRRLRGWGWPGFRGQHLWRQDKGQARAVAAFVGALRDGAPAAPIPFDELLEVSRVSVRLAQGAS